MHPALSIPEILQHIFSNLGPITWHRWMVTRDAKRDLAALARTCTTFQRPALDKLWAHQGTFLNFLRCFPPDLFDLDDRGVVSSGRKSKRKPRLLRPILATDWARPFLYARRVKDFSCQPHSPTLLQILEAISLSMPDGSIFPSLVKLAWDHIPPSEFHFIKLFLTRTVTEISFKCASASHLSILSTLSRSCPVLKRVDLSGWTAIPGSSASLCAFVDELLNIEFLVIGSPSMETLEHIGRVPTLKYLRLESLPREVELAPPVSRPLFVNLESIMLADVTFEAATRFLAMCTDPYMGSVHVTFDDDTEAGSANEFYDALAACHPAHISLHTLSLDSSQVSAHPFHFDLLRTLFCFQGLTHISILIPVAFGLDDADVAELARSWPRLNSLYLVTHASELHPRTTLQCLRILAQHCTDLRALHIALDASAIPGCTDHGHGHVSQRTLISLEVADSPIAAPLPVARYISGIFPNLAAILTNGDHNVNRGYIMMGTEKLGTAFYVLWKEVETHMAMLQEVRKEAVLWAQQSAGQ
ncbi:hypothetical protein DFH07DRAFT_798896 [Mycena maculata]|uniref:F-box domain-containing protein n=1 Tax=Mycena maculata TaxID=230809 RepID=A0AAD7NTZ1_9AGAR|nr:hypothetical protein DFH07DRAFT_798896 [Mycena maculata]